MPTRRDFRAVVPGPQGLPGAALRLAALLLLMLP